MKISKYAKLGILIVASIAILVWGLSYLKGHDFFTRNKSFYVVYDRIDGLQKASKVTLNGHQIGQVNDICFAPDKSGKLVITLSINEAFDIPVNSLAQIVSSDIIGSRSVKIVLNNNNNTYYADGDTIPGALEADLKEQVSMQVLPIKNKAEQLLSTIDSAITVLTVLFNEDARKNLTKSFENINLTIDNLQKTSSDLQDIVSVEKNGIKHIVENVEDITTVFRNNTTELDEAIKNLSSFSDTLSRISVSPIVANISKASEQILSTIEKLNSNDNTAGLLLNNPELYESISELSGNLSYLINDIQANPKRYLHFSALDFGKEYYINASDDVSTKNIVFKVHLISTESEIPLNNEVFNGLGKEVEEYQASGAYSYLYGATGSYTEAIKFQNKARKNFPESTIVAFKNGKLIKLEKALKLLR